MKNSLAHRQSIELDLRHTPLLRKVVEHIVLANLDIDPEHNALAVAQGVGPFSPIINPHEIQ
ncbi:MAG: hypothetical protein CMF52_09350 [Legionellales bacterium]|nr:hypothetical protein [Legionellales bacterium]